MSAYAKLQYSTRPSDDFQATTREYFERYEHTYLQQSDARSRRVFRTAGVEKHTKTIDENDIPDTKLKDWAAHTPCNNSNANVRGGKVWDPRKQSSIRKIKRPRAASQRANGVTNLIVTHTQSWSGLNVASRNHSH